MIHTGPRHGKTTEPDTVKAFLRRATRTAVALQTGSFGVGGLPRRTARRKPTLAPVRALERVDSDETDNG